MALQQTPITASDLDPGEEIQQTDDCTATWADDDFCYKLPSTEEMITDVNNNKKRLSPDSENSCEDSDTQTCDLNTKKRSKKSNGLEEHQATLQKRHPERNISTTFPTNKTMESNKKGTTILLHPYGENASSFCQSPVAIAKGLKNEPFNKIVPKDIRINKRRNIVAIELYETDTHNLKALLQATELGKFKVKCSQPLSDTVCYGVIGPIEEDIDVEEVKEMLKCYTAKVLRVTRLSKFKGGKKELSTTVKIDFEGKILPNKVYLETIAFSVRKYNLPPLRCFKCQGFGHMSNGCTKSDVCNLCSGNHRMQDCTSTTKKCANCAGPHVASARECQYNKDAQEIETMRSQGSSFSEARRQVKSKRARQILTDRGIAPPDKTPRPGPNNTNPNQMVITADVHRSPGSYYENSYANVTKKKIDKDCEEESTNELVNRCIDKAMSVVTNKLVSFLKEAFSLNLQKENSRERKLLLMNLTKHHFGLRMDEDMIEGSLSFDLPDMDLPDTDLPDINLSESDPEQEEFDDFILSQPFKSQIIKTKKVPIGNRGTISSSIIKKSKSVIKEKTTGKGKNVPGNIRKGNSNRPWQ